LPPALRFGPGAIFAVLAMTILDAGSRASCVRDFSDDRLSLRLSIFARPLEFSFIAVENFIADLFTFAVRRQVLGSVLGHVLCPRDGQAQPRRGNEAPPVQCIIRR
jgi:hypothetical protein